MKYCTNCGAEVSQSMKYCGNCGNRIEELAPPIRALCDLCHTPCGIDDSFTIHFTRTHKTRTIGPSFVLSTEYKPLHIKICKKCQHALVVDSVYERRNAQASDCWLSVPDNVKTSTAKCNDFLAREDILVVLHQENIPFVETLFDIGNPSDDFPNSEIQRIEQELSRTHEECVRVTHAFFENQSNVELKKRLGILSEKTRIFRHEIGNLKNERTLKLCLEFGHFPTKLKIIPTVAEMEKHGWTMSPTPQDKELQTIGGTRTIHFD